MALYPRAGLRPPTAHRCGGSQCIRSNAYASGDAVRHYRSYAASALALAGEARYGASKCLGALWRAQALLLADPNDHLSKRRTSLHGSECFAEILECEYLADNRIEFLFSEPSEQLG